MPNRIDRLYSSVLFTKYFVKGWGKPENLKRLCELRELFSNRESCNKMVSPDHPVHIESEEETSDCRLIHGHFITPFRKYIPEAVPIESEKAYFQFVLPKKWLDDSFKPIVIHLAGTGDQHFWRRRTFVAKPLLKEACIGSVILENPFYGKRKPVHQQRSILHNVSDIFVMGGCLLLESLVLLRYLERLGYGPLGLTGLSMGGHMASLAATNWPKPIVVVPCLSGLTASCVFTQGVISRALNWDMLEKQYQTEVCFSEELKQIVNMIEGQDAFKAGQEFAKSLSDQYSPLKDKSISSYELASDKPRVMHAVKRVDPVVELGDDGRTVSTNSLLNLIVRLVRASSSLNLMSSGSKEKSMEELHNAVNASQELKALSFMNGIMDEFTHLKNYSRPVDGSMAIAVAATDDAYVPRNDLTLSDIWPGAEVRYVSGGHVQAYVSCQREFSLGWILSDMIFSTDSFTICGQIIIRQSRYQLLCPSINIVDKIMVENTMLGFYIGLIKIMFQ